MESETNKVFDNNSTIMYNGAEQDDTMQIVKMDEQAPLNDTECRHEVLIPDPTDTIGDAVYHGCAGYKCGVGFYIKK